MAELSAKVSWWIVWRSEWSLVLEEVETYEIWSQRKQTNERSWGVNRSNQISLKKTYLWLNTGTAEEYMLLQPMLIHIRDVSYLFPLNLSVCLSDCLFVCLIVCLSVWLFVRSDAAPLNFQPVLPLSAVGKYRKSDWSGKKRRSVKWATGIFR